MTEFRTVNLASIQELIVDNRGRTCPTAEEGTPLIATNCIKDDHLYPVFENVRYVAAETMKSWFRDHPRPDDIIFVCKGSPGRCAMAPDPVDFAIAQDMVALRPDRSQIFPKYLYYQLRWSRTRYRINELHVGSLIPHFKKKDFDKLVLRIHASVAEQQAIAEVLGALDDKIAANSVLQDICGQLTSALFQRATAHLRVGRVASFARVNGHTVKLSSGELRYLDIACVGEGSYQSAVTMNWVSAPSRARRRVHRGDTVWSTVRPNRRSHALVLENEPNLIASTGLATLTPLASGFSYVYEASRTTEFTDYLVQNALGSAYPAVNGSKFEDAPIPDAAPEEVDHFNAICDPMWERAAVARQESEILAQLRDTLIPALMDGRLRIRDAVEQAEVVL